MILEKGKTNQVIPTFILIVCLAHFPTTALGVKIQVDHRGLTELRRQLESGAADVARTTDSHKIFNNTE